MSVTQVIPKVSNGVDVDPESGEVIGVRKLRASGNSVVLTIPGAILSATGLEQGEHVEIRAEMGGDEILLRRHNGERDD